MKDDKTRLKKAVNKNRYTTKNGIKASGKQTPGRPTPSFDRGL